MKLETIEVRVDPETARRYRSASDEDRRKLEILIGLDIREATGPRRSLDEIMKEMSEQAARNGLTPEILQAILNEK